MWWLIFVGIVVVLLVAGALYLEFRPARRQSRFDRTVDPATNQAILQQQSNSLRNQSSGNF